MVTIIQPQSGIRSDLELWLLVEERFSIMNEEYTICSCIYWLFRHNHIIKKEYNHLVSIMSIEGKKINKESSVPFWPLFDSKPRKHFIQKQILKAIKND